MPAPRSFVLVTSLTLAAAAAATLPATPLFAQDTVQPDVENSKMSVLGEVATTNVLVRSGPNENYYATQRLNKGDQITIVGIKGDWLKVLPPQGAFSYVAKKYVDAAGATGTVKGSDVSVRAGSDLVPTKSTIQTRLQTGDKVTIVGEQDEYYKIQPPEGAYLFISKSLVTPIRALGPNPAPNPGNPGNVAISPAGPGASSPLAPSTQHTNRRNNTSVSRTPEDLPTAPTPAAPNPDQLAAGTEYDKAETDFAAASEKPLPEQPVDDLIARYTALTANQNLPVTLRRNAQARLATLKFRAESQKELQATQAAQAASNERLAKLKAEQEQIQSRLHGTQFFTAVGQLLPSEVQQNGANLYRLADPATSRTVVYVKPDPTLANYANNFVGIKGDVQTDAGLGLKVLTPTQVQQVDPAAVNNSVTAMMIPPSMLPKAPATQP